MFSFAGPVFVHSEAHLQKTSLFREKDPRSTRALRQCERWHSRGNENCRRSQEDKVFQQRTLTWNLTLKSAFSRPSKERITLEDLRKFLGTLTSAQLFILWNINSLEQRGLEWDFWDNFYLFNKTFKNGYLKFVYIQKPRSNFWGSPMCLEMSISSSGSKTPFVHFPVSFVSPIFSLLKIIQNTIQ